MKDTSITAIATTSFGSIGFSFIDTVEPTLRIIALCVSIYTSIAIYKARKKEK